MVRSFARSAFAVIMAFAIVFPPVSDAFARAMGGTGHHAHFDHVWHQASTADIDHDDELDGQHAGDAHSHSFLEHFHLAVMALPAATMIDLAPAERLYNPRVPQQLIGLALTPPGHPPQTRT